MRFKGRVHNLSVQSVNATNPIGDDPAEDVFYTDVQRAINLIPKSDLIIAEDWNTLLVTLRADPQ